MAINGATELYGIMGQPVSHSLSPAMHNRAFQACNLNKVYVPFPVDDPGAAIEAFRAFGVKGASVTIPHKERVIPYLDSIDPVAEKIGAVNTLVLRGNRVHGLNTDWLGANRALAECLDPAGRKICILGAGGSARAIGFGLLEAGAEICLASRTPARGEGLAAVLGCQWLPLAEAAKSQAECLINATSVGMGKLAGESPVAGELLASFRVVMDIVYSPLETRLLREAKAAGCAVVNGLAMLLYQGAAQFSIWTGVEAPLKVMRQALLESLSSR